MENGGREQSGRSYEAVLRDIEAKLKTGSLKLGDRLAGERALAAEYEISRASVRDAIRILTVLGVVKSSPGSGPESGTQIIAEPSVGLSNALRLHMASSSLPAKDVIEARILLEAWAARGAAERCRAQSVEPGAISALHALLDRMDTKDISPEEFHLLDQQFHTELSALAGNIVVETIMGSLREAVRAYVMESVVRLKDWGSVRDTLREQHRAILDATVTGDGERASRLVEEHIRWFYSVRQDPSSY